MSKNIVFRDDFDGDTLDLSKWQPNWLGANDAAISPPINGAEASCYDPAQVSVADSCLVLEAIAASRVDSHGKGYSYASGCVTTRPHFSFTHGKLSARMKLDGQPGAIKNWPAFWADGEGSWPKTGELDVVEGLGGHPGFHFHSPSGGPGGTGALADHPHGWHVYAATWAPGIVVFEYDNVVVGRITEGITDSPMFLIFNLALSNSISGPISVPSKMYVDWVEVSQ